MRLSEDLKQSVEPLWEKTVTHPVVIKLGNCTLAAEKFSVYFQLDHLFLRDCIALMCSGVLKAPDFASAHPLAAFIHLPLSGEEGLFQQYFRDTGRSQQQINGLKHLPTPLGYSEFLRNVSTNGSFIEIITPLLAIEWPYLDWAKRLGAAGKSPANKYYPTWIDIHAGKELDDFVSWMLSVLDIAIVDSTDVLKELFLTTVRYEYLFWEIAYRGEKWPE